MWTGRTVCLAGGDNLQDRKQLLEVAPREGSCSAQAVSGQGVTEQQWVLCMAWAGDGLTAGGGGGVGGGGRGRPRLMVAFRASNI